MKKTPMLGNSTGVEGTKDKIGKPDNTGNVAFAQVCPEQFRRVGDVAAEIVARLLRDRRAA